MKLSGLFTELMGIRSNVTNVKSNVTSNVTTNVTSNVTSQEIIETDATKIIEKDELQLRFKEQSEWYRLNGGACLCSCINCINARKRKALI